MSQLNITLRYLGGLRGHQLGLHNPPAEGAYQDPNPNMSTSTSYEAWAEVQESEEAWYNKWSETTIYPTPFGVKIRSVVSMPSNPFQPSRERAYAEVLLPKGEMEGLAAQHIDWCNEVTYADHNYGFPCWADKHHPDPMKAAFEWLGANHHRILAEWKPNDRHHQPE